jgi:myo-inositol-hexaphosphate 3-phosphohydrolase
VTLVGTSTAFGSGLNNTTLLATATPLGTSSTNAAIAARLYAATDSSAGQWFIPSRDELIAQYNSVVKSRGNFQARNLMSSSEQTPSTNYLIVDQSTGAVSAEARGNAKLFRPIRAF